MKSRPDVLWLSRRETVSVSPILLSGSAPGRVIAPDEMRTKCS
jgi:hypothetical protein